LKTNAGMSDVRDSKALAF